MVTAIALREFLRDAIQKALQGDGLISMCAGCVTEERCMPSGQGDHSLLMLLIHVIRLTGTLLLLLIHRGNHTFLLKSVISLAA